MAKFYRLPDGIEVKSSNDGEVTGAGVWVVHPTYGSIAVDRDILTEVAPPLPPVPDAPAVLIGEQVWARDDIKGVGPVFVLPGGPTLDWEELNGHAAAQVRPIVPLVPDPAADAPALPYTVWDPNSESQVVTVEPSAAYSDRLFVEVDPTHLDRKHVRQLAAALWAWAAREVPQ